MDATIIDHYRKINNGYGATSQKQSDLYLLKKYIATSFRGTPDYESATKVNNVTQELVVIHTDDEFKKTVIAYPDSTFYMGNTVDCYGMKWLITKVDANKQIYTIGEMTQCSILLKWQNASGTIVERWAVVEKPFTSLDENNIISTSDKKYNLRLPYDSETQNLFVNKRFLLEKANGVPLAYNLTSFDGVTNTGILNIGLTQDEYNGTGFPDGTVDNADLMIANYFVPPVTPTGTARITYTGALTFYMGGSYKTLTGTFVDSEGAVIPDVIPVWTWTCISGDENKYTVVVDGSTFKIKALYFPELIGRKVKVELDDSLGLYHDEVLLED